MPILNLLIKNFRNIEETLWELAPGLNVLEGENGQGKTNYLEAAYFLANGRSFRTPQAENLIAFGKEETRLRARIRRGEIENTLEIRLGLGKKELFLEGKPQRSWSKVFGIFRILIFTPESTGLFRTSPGLRRRYFDQAITLHQPTYGGLLRRYLRVLKQRNQLLEEGASHSIREPFDRQWAELTLRIMKDRQRYLEVLLPLWKTRFAALIRAPTRLGARWEGRCMNIETPLTEASLLQCLAETRAEEIRWRRTLLGPNRDDLTVYFGERPVREVGSQGQHRMLVIALKLAEADLFTAQSGTAPVFLLDDIGSELDSGHLKSLLETLGGIQAQTILTSAQTGAFDILSAKTFKVQNGNLISKTCR